MSHLTVDDKDVSPEGMTSESVEEWLQEIAEAEGDTREETLENLVSSYWRLEEIFHLLQDSGIDLDHSGRRNVENLSARGSDSNDLRTRIERLSDAVESLEADTADSRQNIRENVSEFESQLRKIEDEMSEVSRDVSELLDSPLRDSDEILERLATLEHRMDRTESKVSGVHDRVDSVDERVSSVAENSVSLDKFEAHSTEAEEAWQSIWRKHESLQEGQQSLREGVRTEFENIRTILTYLLETSSRNTAQHRPRNDQVEGKIHDHLSEQEILSNLLRRANREGIRSATCGQCDHQVDLRLLDDPICPHCDEHFDGIETKTRYLGLSQRHFLTAADEADGG